MEQETRPKILLVDGDGGERDMIAGKLISFGYDVVISRRLADALEKLGCEHSPQNKDEGSIVAVFASHAVCVLPESKKTFVYSGEALIPVCLRKAIPLVFYGDYYWYSPEHPLDLPDFYKTVKTCWIVKDVNQLIADAKDKLGI